MRNAVPKSERELGDHLLMALVHDLRRHLRTSVGRAQMLQRELPVPLDAPVNEHLAAIISSGQDMNVLLSRLALYAAAGTAPEDQPYGDVSVLFDSALRRLADKNREADIDYEPIRGHAIQAPYSIETVVRELLDNALKFRQGPVKIAVLVEQTDGHQVFGIRDSGIGFDQQYCEKIMLPLERLHPPDLYAGPGLGLAICQRTLGVLGGKLWAESKVNSGSTFWFSFPSYA